MKKKVIALLLSMSMLVGILPTLAFATSGETTPTDATTIPTESTPAVCQICQTENCTKSHVFCQTCEIYDCGVDHTAVPTGEIVKCGTCGQENCESKHENWCATCLKDDCGVDHSAPKTCETCGQENCESGHENWCATCLKDDCGIDHSAPKTCETCGETLSEGHTCPTDPVCSCSVLCKADAPKVDCPVCSEEDGICTGSDKYVTVQAMIDALRTEFKESEREAALAEYEAATKAISELSEEEFALLDLTNYYAAANPTVIPEGPVVCKIGEDEFTSLSEAITAANNAGSATTIVLTSDITLSEKLTISGIVTIDGAGHTIIRGKTADNAWYTGTLFNVSGTLNLNNAVVDGTNNWVLNTSMIDNGTASCSDTDKSTYPFIYNSDLPTATAPMFQNNGTLKIQNATIQNHFGVHFNQQGKRDGKEVINCARGATLVIDKTKIFHCASSDAGAIITAESGNNTIDITDSSITGNFGITVGGIIRGAYSGSTVTLNNSAINNNWLFRGSGFVYVSGGTFVMDGNSTISGNLGTTTYAVRMDGASTFTMNGGSITNNNGGVYVRNATGKVNLNSGKIENNTTEILSYGEVAIEEYGEINGNITSYKKLSNTGDINGTVTLYIPAGSNPNDYFKNTGSHTGNLIVYYTVTDDYPYVLNLDYGGGTDQVGWSGSGHLKWGPNDAETMEVTLADITSAVTVTKYGYTFAGWYYDEALTEKVTDPITLTAKTAECLYAAWEKNRAEINYMAVTQNYGKQAAVSTSGGTVSGSETVDATVAAVNGSTITVNEGYTFAGWFTDEACTQKVTASWVDANNKLTPQKNSEGLYESGSYYALFEEMTTTITYKVAYTGTGSVCFENAAAAEAITDTFGKVTGSPKTVTAKPANGYMFEGWYTDEACTKLHSTDVTLNSSESGTFYAKFIKDHAIVTITKNVDKASSSDQSFILNISGTTYNNAPVNVDVVVVIPAGQTSGSVKVVLPVSDGDYSISDEDGWNWRYKVEDDATITINRGDSDRVLSVTSTLENSKWFADSYIYPYKKES